MSLPGELVRSRDTVTEVTGGLLRVSPGDYETIITMTTTDPVAFSVRLAERYWHAVPCRRNIAVTSSLAAPPAPAGTIAGAWSTWESPLGPQSDAASPASYTDCTITLNGNMWPNWQIDDAAFHLLCDLMTHEVGHFVGYGDEGQPDPRQITYPVLGINAPNYNSVPECKHVTLWFDHLRLSSGKIADAPDAAALKASGRSF